jgi:hypothetical protein
MATLARPALVQERQFFLFRQTPEPAQEFIARHVECIAQLCAKAKTIGQSRATLKSRAGEGRQSAADRLA